MALDITTTLAGLGGIIGGVADASVATDPVIIEAGVTLNGGLPSLLGGVPGHRAGQRRRGHAGGRESVTDLGTVQGSTGVGIGLAAGGAVVNGVAGVVTGVTAGISVAGTVPGVLSTVNNVSGRHGHGDPRHRRDPRHGRARQRRHHRRGRRGRHRRQHRHRLGDERPRSLHHRGARRPRHDRRRDLTNTGTILGTLGHGASRWPAAAWRTGSAAPSRAPSAVSMPWARRPSPMPA